MQHFEYLTRSVCPTMLAFDLDGESVRNVQFTGGCNGNLKAISKLIDGMSVDQIYELLAGNTCGSKTTSCADQLAQAVKDARDKTANK